MAEGSFDPVWDELGKIDYFLDQLARAIERDEAPYDLYDRLAPRYLTRRGELVAILDARAGRFAAQQAAAVPAGAGAGGAIAGGVRTQAAQQVSAPSSAPLPKREPRPVPWTTILTITGAFLVVVASAIFAVATWDMFGVGFKLAFLGVLTLGFYGAGWLVRSRMNLPAGGLALIAVGSAMLLFDGWIAIDGFGLSGPWPWAAWLFVCSGAYWFTEIRVGGRFFGVTGAAAQIAWWWLLGQGLGWTTAPRFAGIALIGLVWAYVGSLARDEGPFAPLATLLRVASPVVIGGAALAVMIDLGIGPATWTEVISAAVVGGAATAAVGRWNLPFGAAALAQVPLFAALFNNIYSFGAGWEHVVLFVALALAYAAAELWRGGWTHGVLALVAELAGWLSLVWVLDAAADVTVAILLGVGASWVLSAHLLMRSSSAQGSDMADRIYSLATAARIGGWLLLVAATVLVPGAREVVPLAGMSLEPRDVALTLWLFAVWAGLMWVVRSPAALLASLPASVYAVAALLAYFVPSWHSGLYAAVLLLAIAAWLPIRGTLSRRLDLDAEALGWVVRVSFGLVVFIGLLSAEVFFGSLVAFETAFMLAVAGVLWGADALAPRGQRLGLVFAATHLVAAVVLASLHAWNPELAGVLGAAAGALGGAAGLLGRQKIRELGTIWAPAAAAAATLAAFWAVEDSGALAAAFAIAALAWLLAAFAARVAWVGLGTGALTTASLLALCAYLEVTGAVTVGIVSGAAFLTLAPYVAGGIAARWPSASRAALLSGAGALALLTLLQWMSWVDPVGAPAWLDAGGHGLAVALAATGAFVIAAGAFERITAAPYVGGALILLAYFAEANTLQAYAIEWYSTPMALYLVWAGWHRARSVPGASVPPVLDVAAVLVGLGMPAIAALLPLPAAESWLHLMWALGLSVAAISAGVALKVRGYFFGGIAVIVLLALVRTWIYLLAFWWLVLGLLGITMLVIALTWERHQQVVAGARQKVSRSLLGWR